MFGREAAPRYENRPLGSSMLRVNFSDLAAQIYRYRRTSPEKIVCEETVRVVVWSATRKLLKQRDQADAILPGNKNQGGRRVLIRYDLF
jgi:hypothetical protein